MPLGHLCFTHDCSFALESELQQGWGKKDICPPRKTLNGCKHARTPAAAVGTWESSQEMCSEQEVTAATGRNPRRRRRGHRRGPGIKPLEIERDGGGKVLDFAPSLAAYQRDFADGLTLTKAAQTQCRSPKQQGGSPGGRGCPQAASRGTECVQGVRADEKNSTCKEIDPYGLAERKDFGGDHWAEPIVLEPRCVPQSSSTWLGVTGLEKGPGTPTPSKSRASRAQPQHQRCPCTPGWGLLQGCPPAGLLRVRGCLETCVEPLRLWQMISSKYPLWRSCVKDVTAASARRDLPKAASVEGMGTARGPGIHHRPGQSCHRYRQLKLPEGSKAVNVREARSRRNFIHCVMFCLFAREG
ncbi:uncharacterized protein LOC115336381 [Aquila chrysaetos chrysaetos]|uniref:uncharacterized protein LOC115336381 n=1 Tax=Aquila chrysaetos chrysaetos TaxID=223781 RepID=UPI0011772F1F|nr:uncharacterized protein LOC115336381 [Aquila chrysaetos chrysaetos]